MVTAISSRGVSAGRSSSEIAETLGCPLQTAYARLYAARREVSRALARLKAKGRVER